MRIILPLGERPGARQAAEDEQSRIGRDKGREAGVADGGHRRPIARPDRRNNIAHPLTAKGIGSRGALDRKGRFAASFSYNSA